MCKSILVLIIIYSGVKSERANLCASFFKGFLKWKFVCVLNNKHSWDFVVMRKYMRVRVSQKKCEFFSMHVIFFYARDNNFWITELHQSNIKRSTQVNKIFRLCAHWNTLYIGNISKCCLRLDSVVLNTLRLQQHPHQVCWAYVGWVGPTGKA